MYIRITMWFLVFAIACTHGYENIALNKPTNQSAEYNPRDKKYQSFKAVDGLKDNLSFRGGQCTLSAGGQKATIWWVDLTSIQSIHDITIYHRTENIAWNASNGFTATFLGFSVYISNTTGRSDGHLCFHDTNFSKATIPSVVNIKCPVHGQYVIYYNERPQSSHAHANELSQYAFNDLCEVEVYGCENVGFYGVNCSIPCPDTKCRYCHIETGTCQGCKPGYQGHQCELPCSQFFYGEACKKKCGNCSDGVTCNHVNGKCVNGCDVGVYGNKCKKPCPIGWYGKNCSGECNNCDTCDRNTGQCTSQCHAGWKGQYCTDECDAKMYGQNCAVKCGACLGYTQCHHINGSCLNGCDAGYKGELCKTACSKGTFGKNCKQICSVNCGVPRDCNKTKGECRGGCQPGWKGLQCNDVCTNNMYGKACSQPCGNCRNASKCHHINGSCPNGCAKGYKDVNCTQKCSLDTYGFDCLENCSTTCINNTCDSVTGYCPMIKKTQQTSNSGTFGAVIGGISGLAIAFVVIAALVLGFGRRTLHNGGGRQTDKTKDSKRGIADADLTTADAKPQSSSQSQRKGKKKGDEAEVDEDELIHSENPYGDFYANETTIRDIPLNQLESVIAEKRMNKNDGFQREYATLPYGELYKCDEGKREENIVKNRYKTTFPYDHSRVILKTETGSDYINANYIEGAERDGEYIAAQGPKQNTLSDFWAMIWQENVSSIVMVTNLKEGTKIKCNQYWPDLNKHVHYGSVSVKMIEEKEYAFFTVRKMTVSNNESNKSRSVTQYHYTAWPDHGTPEPLCLVIFQAYVTRTAQKQINSPTVVHCSAGIGRTGTYIALDALEQIGRKKKKVNVAEYVKKMRENRMNMVQTYEQYMTIFLALNEIYKSPVKINTIEEFIKKAEHMTADEPANQSTLRAEFQLLMKIRPVYTEADFKIAKENCKDGNVNTLLPLDKYSVHLSSAVPKRGTFINAIYVPSFANSRAFIITHYPPAEGAVDFLRLINDDDSATVICMDPLNNIESSKEWVPNSSSSRTVPPFTVRFQSKNETDVNSTFVHILQKNSKKSHKVTIVEPKVSIKTSGTPLDTSQLRSLVSVAQSVGKENPIIVVSSDGASLCGVFCAVHNAIQQINMDENVDVFTAVRQLQIQRPEFCSSLDEYRLVIKAVYDYIQRRTENIYSNQ